MSRPVWTQEFYHGFLLQTWRLPTARGNTFKLSHTKVWKVAPGAESVVLYRASTRAEARTWVRNHLAKSKSEPGQ